MTRIPGRYYLLSICSTKKATLSLMIATISVLTIYNINLHHSFSFSFKAFPRVKTFSYYVNSHRFSAECQDVNLYKLQRLNHVNKSIPVLTSNKTRCPRDLSPPHFKLPSTALLSLPGSGNTWVRHILQQLTGIPTGAIYNDTGLYHKGFPAEGQVKDVLVVKTHGSMHKHVHGFIPTNKFERVIVIIRNIYDAFLAEFKRLMKKKKSKHIAHTANLVVNTTDPRWRSHIFTFLSQWKQIMNETFDFPGPLLVIFYEDLKYDLLHQLVRAALFLSDQAKELKEFSFCCVLKEIEGSFHRKPNNQTADDVFDFSERIIINKNLQNVASVLQKTHSYVSERLLAYQKPIE